MTMGKEGSPQTHVSYLKRSVEGLVLPSSNQLVTAARKKLESHFARDFEVPVPPQDLFETLRNFAERGIKGLDEVYYQPSLQLTEDHELWEGEGIVKPEPYFWEQIKDGNFPEEAAMLEEGWYIGDGSGKPMYANGQQRYGENDYMGRLMAYLRGYDRIQKYSGIPDDSRFGASSQQIEKIILPEFALGSDAKGNVRIRTYMEFVFRGNIAHPEYGLTNTLEWHGDPAFQGASRLVGGGGLANVNCRSVFNRDDRTGFSIVLAFPSKP